MLEDLPQREGVHHRPRALADLQYAQLLQEPQPLAHRGPADAQLLRELSLGWEAVAGAVPAFPNLGYDAVRNSIGQGGSLDLVQPDHPLLDESIVRRIKLLCRSARSIRVPFSAGICHANGWPNSLVRPSRRATRKTPATHRHERHRLRGRLVTVVTLT